MLFFLRSGSVVEFGKILPLLVGAADGDSDFVFEVIAPSIPGYGFSSAPAKVKNIFFIINCCMLNFRDLLFQNL